MSFSFRNNQRGFTLLEVLIAMAILMVISFGLYRATVQTFHLRDSLSVEGNFHSGIRLAMGLMERDISQLYSPLSVVPPSQGSKPTNPNLPNQPPPPPDADEMRVLTGDRGQASQFWGPALDKTGVRPSRFVGTANKMSFIAVSHIRVYRDAPESELAKITYELREGARDPDLPDTQVLVKVESANAFEDDDRKDKAQATYPLLPGIKKLQFSYWRQDRERWESSWDSEDQDTKNLYPDRVKVEMEVVGPQRMSFQGIYVFKPEIPIHGLDPST